MAEAEKITIIEGPTPAFAPAAETWPVSLAEGFRRPLAAICKFRTFNGPAMIERCRRAWGEGRPVLLDYRQPDGLRREAEVLAARCGEVPEGHVLFLWVRLNHDPDQPF